MYVIESELRQQFDALARTVQALTDQQGEAKEALDGIRTLCVLGCGSSFSLAKSAATLFSQHTGVPAYALPAGDVLVNFESYKKLLAGCTLLLLSRSGSTSEVLRAATRCKQELGCRVLSVCAREDAPVEGLSHWNLRLPWALTRRCVRPGRCPTCMWRSWGWPISQQGRVNRWRNSAS